MKLYLILTVTLLLAGCTTPKTMLENKKTGQIVSCGGNTSGSIMGGAIGYHIQKSNDSDCVEDYQKEGFKPIVETETAQ